MYTITKHKQYFTITHPDFTKLECNLFGFHNKQLTTYRVEYEKMRNRKRRYPKYVRDKEFYIKDPIRKEFRYPIEMYKYIIQHLNFIGVDNREIDVLEKTEPIKGKDVSLKFNPKYTPEEHQDKYHKEIMNWKKNNLLIDLQTGKGKTFISVYAIAEMGKRFALLIPPKYINNPWIMDLKDYLTNVKRKNIYIVKGSDSIRKLLTLPKSELNKIKCVILSMPTIERYISEYLNPDISFNYSVTPDKFLDYLEIPYIINDETHQLFHMLYTIMMFFDANLYIHMTATLMNKDQKINSLYNILIPQEHRINSILPYDQYIHLYSIRYTIKNVNRIRFQNGYGYNHPTFEKSVMRHSTILDNYLEMIFYLFMNGYIKRRTNKKYKVLIFASTIAMCMAIVDYIKKRYKDIRIGKYTEEDPIEVVKDCNVIVSTYLSAGTALDIKGLITVIQTINIESIQANYQSLGRLRKRDDIQVNFYYIWCVNIPKHRDYNSYRLEIFKPVTKEIHMFGYNKII